MTAAGLEVLEGVEPPPALAGEVVGAAIANEVSYEAGEGAFWAPGDQPHQQQQQQWGGGQHQQQQQQQQQQHQHQLHQPPLW